MARSAAKFKLNAEQQQLVVDNLNLARREAWRYQRRTEIDYRTLESVAFEGLCQAAYKYDPELINEHTGQSMKFSSIAVPYTRGAILHYIRDRTYLLRLSHKMRENWLKGRKLIYKGYSDYAIAEALGLDLSEWLETRVTCSGPPLELKEQGAPTIDIEIPDIDMTQQYIKQAEAVLKELTEIQQEKLQGFLLSETNKYPVDAVKTLDRILKITDCPEPDFSTWELED
ncbi:MAG: hypothetical protein ACO24H_06370 [Polynucleobacter sp.]